jgi:hypothetical protein
VRSKRPDRYHQQAREAKRDASIVLAHRIGGLSRHEEDPEGSAFWVEHGYWPKEKVS